jgi:hypothetical protein
VIPEVAVKLENRRESVADIVEGIFDRVSLG